MMRLRGRPHPVQAVKDTKCLTKDTKILQESDHQRSPEQADDNKSTDLSQINGTIYDQRN